MTTPAWISRQKRLTSGLPGAASALDVGLRFESFDRLLDDELPREPELGLDEGREGELDDGGLEGLLGW